MNGLRERIVGFERSMGLEFMLEAGLLARVQALRLELNSVLVAVVACLSRHTFT